MAERKVLNKYYPPDFDPSKLRRFEKKSVRKMCNVRMMLPMSVRCYTCGNYMYIGTKFNMKVETVKDEDYLGIKIYRFYFKCTQCYSEITFRTDPKNHDYIAEWGASRNHEPWKDMLMAEEEYKEMKQNEMKEDAMKSLEHRTYDSKREMDILDALDQVKSLNRRQAQVDYEEMINKVIKKEVQKEENDIEEEIQKEASKVYERVKIRRIRDYNDLGLNEDKENKNDEEDNLNGNFYEHFSEENINGKSNNLNGVINNNNLKGNILRNNTDQDRKEKFSQIDEKKIKNDESKLDNKVEIDNDYNLLNKKRNLVNEEKDIEENKIYLSGDNNKRSDKSYIQKDDFSSDSDSIEKEFEKNKEIFKFSSSNTKLKITKNANNTNNFNKPLNRIIDSKKPNLINGVQSTRTKPVSLNKANSIYKAKISGLTSLISYYSDKE